MSGLSRKTISPHKGVLSKGKTNLAKDLLQAATSSL
jgi:hypothetical protein